MNEIASDIIYAVIRSFISMSVLFLLSKLLGPRQISQMSLYDYILGITIGSVAATMAVDETIPVYVPITAMAVYVLFTFLMSVLTNKSIKARKIFSQIPSMLIDNGKIIERNMKKMHLDINDLTSAARLQGIFDLSSVYAAVLEQTGNISFLQKISDLPVTPASKACYEESSVFANIIIDGKEMPNALKAIGKDSNWLKAKMKERNIPDCGKVFLAAANSRGDIYFFEKDTDSKGKDYFI